VILTTVPSSGTGATNISFSKEKDTRKTLLLSPTTLRYKDVDATFTKTIETALADYIKVSAINWAIRPS
jgi:hypothetical protein